MSALRLIGAGLALATLLGACAPRPLRVCADPNNLPFSNDKGEGLENRLVELLAKDLGRKVVYTWWAQRRGFVRNTLKARRCDVWPGVAKGLQMLATTQPYYRSTYVFVTRADRGLDIRSFDDPRLRRLKIGVQMVGNDANNTPPAHALARRGIVSNVRGYMLYGDYRRPNPPSQIIEAVARGDIDVALAWGPMAGYFAARSAHPLKLSPAPANDGPAWPMTFDIAMGVRKDDAKFRRLLDQELARRRPAIDLLLARYHVPQAQR